MDINKTYCEERTQTKIDWWDRLNKLHEVDEDTLRKWYEDSNIWITCACGNQCSIIPRDKLGEPEDSILYELGMDFTHLMSDAPLYFRDEGIFDIIEDLKKTLHKIEQRSAYLINKIKRQKNHE